MAPNPTPPDCACSCSFNFFPPAFFSPPSDLGTHVIALCPNCHRRVHAGADGETYNAQLNERMTTIEPVSECPFEGPFPRPSARRGVGEETLVASRARSFHARTSAN